ncbi:MAG: MATE family efflux transporter [Fervidobacterium sp.]|nr:MATE family efflux transporter [Fervidobacterium sp.]
MQKNASLDLLLGDYKKAIVRLSIPNMISMLVQTIYNLVDAIWVAGLGTVDLAAMGFFFPIFMIVMSIATGITIGTSSAISRKIGAKDYNSARSIAEHSLLLALIIGIFTMVFGILSLKTVLIGIGATGQALEKAYEYGFIIYIFTLPLMFNNTAIGILRGEGDSKRPMYAVISSSILNIVLDPIFIYTFKLGISGAAWATGVSILFAFFILSYLLFVSKNTFLRISFKNFSYNSLFIKDTFFVGFPTALAQITMSVAIYVLNIFVAKVGGNTGIATFTAAWRIINLGTLTIIGISSAVTSVTGVAYGAKDIARLKNSLTYAIRFGEIFGISIMVLIFVFARPLAFLFSYTKSSTSLLENIAQALRILCLFLPGTPFGMLTSGMFQGIGQGFKSLATTILRTMVFQIFWTWIFVDVFKIGLSGVWWGIVVGNATASMVTYSWGKITIEKLKIKFENSKS